MALSRQQVLQLLRSVKYPGFTRDIVSFGVVRNLKVESGRVEFQLQFGPGDPSAAERIEREARAALEAAEGIVSVDIRRAGAAQSAPSLKVVGGGRPSAAAAGSREADLIPGVRHTVAVASGKGGVGKSTVAVNLAIGLAGQGAAVGLLDVDIYGPSVPIMMGMSGERPTLDPEARRLVPFERYGVRFMSLGFLVEPDSAVVWRGPMVMKAIDQLLREVAWGDLDVMVLDMPPGTGDAQLTVSQKLSLAGAVIVTTPQDVALADAVKGVSMFRKVDVPILGIVENMSYFQCPHCSERTEIFSRGGGREQAERLGVPFLGEIPLDPAIRASGDSGRPVTSAAPDSPSAKAFREIASRVGAAVLETEEPAQGSIFDRFRKVWRDPDS